MPTAPIFFALPMLTCLLPLASVPYPTNPTALPVRTEFARDLACPADFFKLSHSFHIWILHALV